MPALLFPGNPVTPGTPQNFTGIGTAAVQTAISSYEAAIGGADNDYNYGQGGLDSIWQDNSIS